ncbi:uncharacterized protein A4U43_C03F15090 [Asparagus officinalis]|uniref:Uncharacterized protein n=1 Tax=Asparagus officinalis TaxID=4686 RepID=A0A5P1FD13_ASPOF|nr:uncharacterized protein A4U43_C03F15090 [Asparagus officinalis]
MLVPLFIIHTLPLVVGQGNNCGFGMRGQTSRLGPGVRKGFEGGQMPLYRRLPKLRRSLELKANIQVPLVKFAWPHVAWPLVSMVSTSSRSWFQLLVVLVCYFHVGCLVCCFHVDDSCSAWLLLAYFHALCDWVDQFCESEFVFQLAFGFRCLVFGAKLLCWLLVCAFLGCSLLLLGPWTLNFCVGLWLAMVAMVSALAWPLVGQLWLAFGFS